MQRWISVVLVLLLSGCQFSPKEYRYVPPSAQSDKQCVSRCSGARRSCEKICRLKHSYCFMKEEIIYGADHIPRTSSCYASCNCTMAYNTCYRACGGEVFEKNPASQ